MLLSNDYPSTPFFSGLGRIRRLPRVRIKKNIRKVASSRGDEIPDISDPEVLRGIINDLERLRILAGLARAAKLDNAEGITESLTSSAPSSSQGSGFAEMNADQYAAYRRANKFINDFIKKGMELRNIKGVPSEKLPSKIAEKKDAVSSYITQNVMNAMGGGLGSSGQQYLYAKAVADAIIAEDDKAQAEIQGGLNQGLAILNKKISQGANEAVAKVTSTFSNVGGAVEGMNDSIAKLYHSAQGSLSDFGSMILPGETRPTQFFTYANSLSVIPPNMDVNNPNDVVKYGSASIAILVFPYLIDALDANAEKLLAKIPDKDVKRIANLYIKSLALAIQQDRTGDVDGILASRAKAISKEINQTIGKKAADSAVQGIKREIQNIKFARSQSEIEEYMTNINALSYQLKQNGGEVPGNLIAQMNDAVRVQKDRIQKEAAAGPSWKTETDPNLRQKKLELSVILSSLNSDLIALESRVQTYKSFGGAAPDFNPIQYKIQQANKISQDLGRNIDAFDKSSLADAKRRISTMTNTVSTHTPIGGGGPGVSVQGNNPSSNPYNYYPSSGGEMGPFQQTQPPSQPNYTIAGLDDFTAGLPSWVKILAAVAGSFYLFKALSKK